MNELGTYIVIFSLLALYHSEFRFLLEPFAFFSGDLLLNNWKFIFLGCEVKMSNDHWLLINDHWSLIIVQWTMFMSRYLLFMNYYSFLAGFKIKRFFDWCGEQDLPVDDDNKDNYDKYHDGNNNETILKNIMLIKIANLIYPLILATLSMPWECLDLTGFDIHMIMTLSVIMFSFFFKVEQVSDS